MADGAIQVAPNSTGALLHTRTRTVQGNTVHEQYVTVQGQRVVTYAGGVTSLRIPIRAATSQVLFTCLNSASAANLIAIRRIAVEVDTIVAKTTLSPWVRTYRITAQSGGTQVTPSAMDAAQTLASTGVTFFADHQADGVSATTALAGTLAASPNAGALWQQVTPRMATQAGIWNPESMPMLPDDGGFVNDNPLVLRAGQGFMLRAETPAAPTAADWSYGVKVVFEEYTAP